VLSTKKNNNIFEKKLKNGGVPATIKNSVISIALNFLKFNIFESEFKFINLLILNIKINKKKIIVMFR
jgi:hypothetical protein